MRNRRQIGQIVRVFEILRARVSRGNKAFFALGAIYFREDDEDFRVRNLLRSQFPNPPDGQVFYRWGLKRRKGGTISLLVAGVGRLGNSVIQTLNVAALAKTLGGKESYYHRFDRVQNQPLTLSKGLVFRKLPFFAKAGVDNPGVIFRTYALESEKPLLMPCSSDMTTARDALAKKILETKADSVGERDLLTVYLRSGDVFIDNPEAHYGQPPWAFYEKVLKFRPWARVELIAEDRGNPNHDLIVKWCTDSNVPLQLAGQDLGDAIRAVAHASNLVTARGTFVPAIVFLSEGPKEVFQFHDERNPLMCRENLTLWRVTDVQGEYASSLLAKNWENSEEQRKLMVSYPESRLSEVLKDGE